MTTLTAPLTDTEKRIERALNLLDVIEGQAALPRLPQNPPSELPRKEEGVMTSDRLKEAARVLRERADDENVPVGPWAISWDGLVIADDAEIVADPYNLDEAARLIATMHPGVALALADWLDYTAKAANAKGRHHSHADRVADLILGDQP